MATEIKPIRTEADYETALSEVERLWGAKSGTPKGDRIDLLATVIEEYEERHYAIDTAPRSQPSAADVIPPTRKDDAV